MAIKASSYPYPFYESFQNKEDLLVAVYRKLIQDIEADAMDILNFSKR